jgi:hypothetical protein
MSDYKFACPSCGQHLMGDASYAGTQITCPGCQRPMTIPTPAQAAVAVTATSPSPPQPPPTAVRAGTPSPHRPSTPPPSPGTFGATPRTSGLAIASLICSCASLVAGPFGAIPGVICGHMARARIRRDPSLGGHGLAKAGLIVGYSLLGLMVVWLGFVALLVAKGVKQGIQRARQQAAQQPRPEPSQQRGRTVAEITPSSPETSAPVDTTPDGRGWTLDLARAEIPSSPVTGRIQGQPFKMEKVTLEGGWLKFVEGKDFFADREMDVVIFENDTAKLSGRTFTMPKKEFGVNPHIYMKWKEGGKAPRQSSFVGGYALRLEFGTLSGGKLPGKIYLCVPDREKSFVSGAFEVEVKGRK